MVLLSTAFAVIAVLGPATGIGQEADIGSASEPAVRLASAPDVRLGVGLAHTGELVEGERVTYTVTVANLGARAYDDVQVTQVVPEGVLPRSAVGADGLTSSQVTWHVDLAPGEVRRLEASAEIRPGAAVRLSTTACVAPAPARPIAVCDTDTGPTVASGWAWAPTATLALTGIVVPGSALLLWLRLGSRGARAAYSVWEGLARRWRLI